MHTAVSKVLKAYFFSYSAFGRHRNGGAIAPAPLAMLQRTHQNFCAYRLQKIRGNIAEEPNKNLHAVHNMLFESYLRYVVWLLQKY